MTETSKWELRSSLHYLQCEEAAEPTGIGDHYSSSQQTAQTSTAHFRSHGSMPRSTTDAAVHLVMQSIDGNGGRSGIHHESSVRDASFPAVWPSRNDVWERISWPRSSLSSFQLRDDVASRDIEPKRNLPRFPILCWSLQ